MFKLAATLLSFGVSAAAFADTKTPTLEGHWMGTGTFVNQKKGHTGQYDCRRLFAMGTAIGKKCNYNDHPGMMIRFQTQCQDPKLSADKQFLFAVDVKTCESVQPPGARSPGYTKILSEEELKQAPDFSYGFNLDNNLGLQLRVIDMTSDPGELQSFLKANFQQE